MCVNGSSAEMIFACDPSDMAEENGIFIKKKQSVRAMSRIKCNGTVPSYEEIAEHLPTVTDRPLGGKESSRKYVLYVFDRDTDSLPAASTRVSVANADDSEDILRLLHQMYSDTEGRDLPPEIAKEILKKDLRDTLVIRENGRLLSMLRIAFRGGAFARINTVVTSPEARGKGLARELVAYAVSYLKNEGLTPTVLASSKNPAANRLYLGIGFDAVCELYEYRVTDRITENPLIINTIA